MKQTRLHTSLLLVALLLWASSIYAQSTQVCTNTKKIIAATDYVRATAGTPAPSGLKVNQDHYGETGKFLDWKGTTGEVYFPVSLPASTYSFAVSLVNFTNAWMNIYSTTGTGDACTVGGTEYKKLYNHGFGDNYGQTFMQLTWSNITLAEGDYVLGIYAEQWTALRDIVITASTDVFCESTDTYALTIKSSEHGTVTTNPEDVSAIASGKTVTLTATPADGYMFDKWVDGEGMELSTDNPYSLKMDADKTVQALFKPFTETYTLIVTGTDANVGSQGDNKSNDGSLNTTSKADPTGVFEHNVLKVDYSMPSRAWAQWNLMRDQAYTTAASGTTGIAFWYRTESTNDQVAFIIEYNGKQKVFQLTATNGAWRYCYFAFTTTSISSIGFYVNQEKNGSTTAQSSGTFYLSEIKHTNLTAAADRVGGGQTQTLISELPWVPAAEEDASISKDHSLLIASGIFNCHFHTLTLWAAAAADKQAKVYSRADGTLLGTLTFVSTSVSGTDSATLFMENGYLPEAGVSIKMADENIIHVTRMAAPTQVPIYKAWPWKHETDTFKIPNWEYQIALGPEHFTTAKAGDKLLVRTTSCVEGAEGSLQGAKGYVTLEGKAYHLNGTEVSYRDNAGLRDFYIGGKGYYHLFTDKSLARAQKEGIVIKGQNYNVTEVLIEASCSNDTMRSQPDVMVYGDEGDEVLEEWEQKYSDPFDFGNWDHKINFVPAAFARTKVGNVLRININPTDGSLDPTVSFRCDVDTIDADSQGDENIQWVKTTGDISFDRTITNLDGDAPDAEGYVDLYITEEMLKRLKEGGLIVCGKGSALLKVELVVGPFQIGSMLVSESRLVPKCGVDTLIIWQGSEALNTDSIRVNKMVQYIRPATGGVSGNTLEQWATFCVPFPVNKIFSTEASTGTDYPINAVYRNSPENDPDNPQGEGSFWLQGLTADNPSGVNEVFRSRWTYIDTPYPKADSAYIILFKDMNWFSDNPIVKFCQEATDGKPIMISGKQQQHYVYSDGSMNYFFYANNTMYNMPILDAGGKPTSAYLLDAEGKYFVLQENAVVKPFECYVQTTETFKIKFPSRIAFRFIDEGGDTPTLLLETEDIDMEVHIYDLSGRPIPDLQSASPGVYIIRQGKTTRKVVH